MSEGKANGARHGSGKQRQKPVWLIVAMALIVQGSIMHVWYQWRVMQPCPPPPLPHTKWRSLADFLQKCDKLPEPTPPSRSRKQLGPPVPEPQTLLELFGAGPPPPDRPRDPQSLVKLMQNITDVVQRCRHEGVCPMQEHTCVSDACPSYRPCPKKDKNKLRIGALGISGRAPAVCGRAREGKHCSQRRRSCRACVRPPGLSCMHSAVCLVAMLGLERALGAISLRVPLATCRRLPCPARHVLQH